MFELLEYDFMQNALWAVLLVSIATSIIGSLVVVNKMVFVAGGIAHGSYAGLGVAVFLGFSPLLGALGAAVVFALIIALVSFESKDRIDTMIGAMWAFGMAAGIILLDLTPGYNVELMSYLFGSILGLSSFDIVIMSVLNIFIVAVIVLFYKEILAVSFDTEFAMLQGINAKIFYVAMIILIALGVIVSIQAVGLILIIALLTIPPYIAEKFVNSLAHMILVSFFISLAFMLSGLSLAYAFDLSSGASIIIVAAVAMFLVYGYTKVFKTQS
ncbi:MAG: metal ABC transporter permease [Campylobacterota bacterium]